MHAELIRAINHKFLVSFYYHDVPHLVVPCYYGIDAKKNPVLRAYEPGVGWDNFNALHMKGLVVTQRHFNPPPRRDRHGERDMARVIARL